MLGRLPGRVVALIASAWSIAQALRRRASSLRQIFADQPSGQTLLRQCGRQQNVRNLARTFDMAVVASLQFSDLPAGSTSFSGEPLEERPRRISFRNAGNEGGWNARLPIGRKTNRLLKATQTKIAQPGAHEI